MTAEVAILNKMAVALAADSTITASYGVGDPKTFQSADKLFELSLTQPIGIMFYGNANVIDLPTATLIKEFRSEQAGKDYPTVNDALEAFIDFLALQCSSAPDIVKKRDLTGRLVPQLAMFIEHLKSESDAFIQEELAKPDSDFASLTERLVERQSVLLEVSLERIRQLPDIELFGEGELLDFDRGVFDDAIKATPNDMHLDGAILDLLYSVSDLLLRKSFMMAPTGFVVAGFGSDERLPSLKSCEVDGFSMNRLRVNFTNECDISRDGRQSAVFGFAQHDVMDRFLYGFDDEVQEALLDFSSKSVDKIFAQVIERLETEGIDPAVTGNILGSLKTARDGYVQQLEHGCLGLVKERGTREIEDMILFMPKPELAEMAESLIHLTSIRRRVSKGMETVGGATDVAVVSRSDGFVWIKRKHYFSADLNARYVDRAKNV